MKTNKYIINFKMFIGCILLFKIAFGFGILKAQTAQKSKSYSSPFELFGITSDSLKQLKAGGTDILLRYGNKQFNAVEFTEEWFGINKIKIDYILEQNKLFQIKMTLPKEIKRENALKKISVILGQPFETKSMKKNAIAVSSALWIVGGVHYELNDYQDSICVVINQALLSNYKIYSIPAGSYIIQKVSGDFNGDGINDYVSLVGHRYDQKSFYYNKLYFIYYNGKTKKESVTDFPKEYEGSYEPTITVENFTNKKSCEIFFSGPTGGSGGIINYLVYSFGVSEGKLLFSPNNKHILHIKGKLLNDYNAEIILHESNKKYKLNLANIKQELDEQKYYDSGKVIKNADIWINPYGMMELKKNNGINELYGTQAIKAVANYMTIGYAYSTWKYQKNKFVLVESSISGIKN